MMLAGGGGESDNTWFFDSGASVHMTSRKEWLHDFKQLNPPRKVWFSDESWTEATGVGTVWATGKNRRGQVRISLSNVLYVPSLKRNLISSSTILSKGFYAIIDHHGAVIKHKETDTVVLEAKPNGKMLEVQLDVKPVEEQVNYVKVDDDQLQLLHRRFRHIGEARLRMMIKQLGG